MPRISKATLLQLFVVAGVLAFVALFALSLQLNASGQLQFTHFDGKSFRLSELRGKVVVVNIWASWCDPCKDEAAVLESTWRAYQASGVVLLGVDYVDTEPPARAFMQKYHITYPNGPDLGSNIYRAFRARGVPETYVIDQSGTIARVFVGPVDETQLTRTIEGLLAKAAR